MSIRRSNLLVAVVVLVALPVGGCLTVDPSVTVETNDSAVFERLSATEPWSGPGVRVNATLASTPAAKDVNAITVVRENGLEFQTLRVAPGQTTVVLSVPANQNVTLVASNSVNSTTIETLNVTTDGRTLL